MFLNLSNFDEVYDKYSDMLYRLAYSYLNSKEDAEDVVQEAFIKYMKSLHILSDETHERRWLIRVVINCCHDTLRKNRYRNHENLDDIGEIATKENDTGTNIIEQVSVLPEKYKTAIILHYLEGYSVEETAKMLGKSVSAVKMRLSRGRDLLKKNIEQEEAHV